MTASNKYLKKTEQYVSPLGESLSVRVDKGDLVMSICGTIGRPIIIDFPSCIHDGFVQLYEIKDADTEYLYYILQYHEKDLENKGQPGTQVNLNTGIVENFEIFFPPQAIQRKIARILSTADAVIEKTQAAIAKYKAIKQGMLHDLFTRGIDPVTNKLRPTYEGAPHLYKESKLGWIPKEWEVAEIVNIIQPIMSNVDKHIREDEIAIFLCNYMDVYTNRYLTKNISFSEGSVNASEMQRFSLCAQDVIITKDSETPDDIAVPAVLLEEMQNLICGYHLCILRSKDLQKLNGEFLMMQLQLQEINNQFATRANGSTRYGLTIDAIEKVRLKIPNDIDEQIKIANKIKTIDNKLQTEQTYLHKLQQIKAGLMADLLSGKKSVTVEEAPAN
ncbi:MAG: restriction endonuclease subunit S [Deltaproteobacteria bacterium]|nr:restriction endonuclease subunit S [Deltaproteobacteria bacterium]